MLSEEAIKNKLEEDLSADRFAHTQAVVKTALALAEKQELSLKNVKTAALLHDCAKGFPEDKLREWASASGWLISNIELQSPQLLHAPAGAYRARTVFGIDIQEILEAIRYHTIGHPHMGKLAGIIFVADFIEPGRDFSGVSRLRKLAEEDFTKTVVEICNSNIIYNIKQKRLIHPYTLDLRNSLLRGEHSCLSQAKKQL